MSLLPSPASPQSLEVFQVSYYADSLGYDVIAANKVIFWLLLTTVENTTKANSTFWYQNRELKAPGPSSSKHD